MTSRPLLATHRPQPYSSSGFAPRASSRGSAHPPSLPLNADEQPNVIDLTIEPTRAAVNSTGPSIPAIGRPDDHVLAQNNGLRREIAVESSDDAASGGAQLSPPGRPDIPVYAANAGDAEDFVSPRKVPTVRGSSPPPLPARPGSDAPKKIQQPPQEAVTQSSGLGKEASLKPYVLIPPPFAPRFPKERPVDFFPWSGNHSEDALSEQVTKQGFYDKSQVSQNETNTASTALRQTFKHKSGLQTLSSLFVSIYEQRQAHGRITATSTFKPPPRVTLTDTKREAWLRDLANSSVPLRRLSRTIPHGIRGKVLLEQCLGKNIPTVRAVWLAKCVGANEMRAFKRKGASAAFALGGEVKWVKDWTVFVEQFLEGVISNCGEKEWKSKMNYATRLSSHLFTEHLLDKDHYFDWVLTSLAGSSLDKTPIWLLVLQIFWEDLIQSRKNGSRLAQSLLEKIHMATTCGEKELFIPIVQRLSHLITRLLVSRPSNFVSPRRWIKYETILRSCIDHDDPAVAAIYARVSKRNLRLAEAKTRQGADAPKRSRSRLVKLLDSAKACFQVEELCSFCLKPGQDHRMLIQTLLEWVSSSYREGVFRVFLAVRILRELGDVGTDINGHILAFLGRPEQAEKICEANLYLLIAELVRCGHFSTSRYLQWLIARGALSNRQALSSDDPCEVRLLAELPLHGLPTHVLNLRRMLLREASFHTGHELRSIAQVKGAIAQELSDLFPAPDRGPVSEKVLSEISLSSLSRTVLSEVCHWIRQQVDNRASMSNPEEMNSLEQRTSEAGAIPVTVHEFNTLRYILEECQDLSALADVVLHAMSSINPIILASIADTLNANLGSFAAIGAINGLFHGLVERERAVSGQTSPEAFLLTAIVDLGSQIPGQDEIVRRLRQDLSRCEQRKVTAAAWSPISDHMPEVLPHTDIKEEVERTLASGTSIEKHTLARLFEALLLKLESVSKHSEEAINIANLLSRLRRFDLNGFDKLMIASLNRLLNDERRSCLSDIVAPLVGSGSVTLLTLFECSTKSWENDGDEGALNVKIRANMAFLELITDTTRARGSISNQNAYRWRLQQRRFIDDHALTLLASTLKVVDMIFQSKNAAIEHRLDCLLESPSFVSILRALIVHNNVEVQGCFRSTPAKSGRTAFLKFDHRVDQFLQENYDSNGLPDTSLVQEDVTKIDPGVRITRIMRKLDDFTLPFCKMNLQLVFEGSTPFGVSTESRQRSATNSLGRSIDSAVAEEDFIWVDAISVLNSSVASQIRERAEERILSLIPTSKIALAANIGDQESDRTAALQSLSVIAATAYSIPQHGAAQLGPSLVGKIEGLLQLVTPEGATENPPPVKCNLEEPSASRLQSGTIHFWVDVLLRIVIVHKGMFQPARAGALDQARLLIALCSILVNEFFQEESDLTDTALDVGSCLIDGKFNPIVSLLKFKAEE
ncbi:MAG: hypothetical protein M1812_005730 [Candelaria pacifica]|nr:MAG: hypothetical protein M1812_005730 [Candelaria pacifica]